MSLVMGVVTFFWPGWIDFPEKIVDWMNEMDLEDRNKDISENSQEKDLQKVVEWVNDIDLKDRKEDFTEHSQDKNIQSSLVVLRMRSSDKTKIVNLKHQEEKNHPNQLNVDE